MNYLGIRHFILNHGRDARRVVVSGHGRQSRPLGRSHWRREPPCRAACVQRASQSVSRSSIFQPYGQLFSLSNSTKIKVLSFTSQVLSLISSTISRPSLFGHHHSLPASTTSRNCFFFSLRRCFV